MVTLAAPPMSEKKSEVCSYASIRIDDQVLPWARAAAALSKDITVQEFISDAVLKVAAQVLGKKPFKRRPAPPKPHGKGRPRKPAP